MASCLPCWNLRTLWESHSTFLFSWPWGIIYHRSSPYSIKIFNPRCQSNRTTHKATIYIRDLSKLKGSMTPGDATVIIDSHHYYTKKKHCCNSSNHNRTSGVRQEQGKFHQWLVRTQSTEEGTHFWSQTETRYFYLTIVKQFWKWQGDIIRSTVPTFVLSTLTENSELCCQVRGQQTVLPWDSQNSPP